MFLDDLLEAGVIQLCEFGQVMDIGNDVAEHLFQQQEVIVGGRRPRRTAALPPTTGGAVQPSNNVIHVNLALLDALDDLLALALLEVENLVQFTLEQGDKNPLIVFGPVAAGGLGVLRGGVGDEVCFQGLFEVVVGDVVGMVLPDHGGLEMFTEPVTGS